MKYKIGDKFMGKTPMHHAVTVGEIYYLKDIKLSHGSYTFWFTFDDNDYAHLSEDSVNRYFTLVTSRCKTILPLP